MPERRVSDSHYWPSLRRFYRASPSVALCRVPELEYAARLPLAGATLDHCCGDGLFASLAWPHARFTAGCDLDCAAAAKCQARGFHARVDVCDVAASLPYTDAVFDLVFNNSAFEHVPDLDAALCEVARVTKPGGLLAFNVLNHRYFQWWPPTAPPAQEYREWQPFFHALSHAEWSQRLAAVHFAVEETHGYFPRETAQKLAVLDGEFSGTALRQRPSAVVKEFRARSRLGRWWWWQKLGNLPWVTEPDAGAGYFFTARRQWIPKG